MPVKHAMGEDETFFSIDKAKKMLGFAPKHGWKTEIKA